jgi:S-methylmethionine-dependent homocysteine/selenocysteine methylase
VTGYCVTGYRAALPQLGDRLLLSDGGLETWLTDVAGQQLVDFAAFPLLDTDTGRQALEAYYRPYLELARHEQRGIVLDTPTWRASPDWGARLGYDLPALTAANRDAVALLDRLRAAAVAPGVPVVISGCIGPRTDEVEPLVPDAAEQARAYHAPQVEAFAGTAADLVTAMTLATPAEAIGIAWAARAAELPVAISFTTAADGRLPDGTPLAEAIELVDDRTGGWPAYYLVNCAHPSQFLAALSAPPCRARIRGVRANASAADADGAAASAGGADSAGTEVVAGDAPDVLAGWYPALRAALPLFTVAGGCCGTDDRHVAAIAAALR